MFQGEPCHIQCKGANTKEKLPISSAVYGVHRSSGQLPPRQRFCAIGIVDEPEAAALALGVTDGAIVDIGGGTTGVSILRDGELQFSIDEPTGGFHFDLVIAGSRRISLEEAEVLKLDKAAQRTLYPAVRPVMEKIARIIRGTFDTWTPPTIYLTGGCSAFYGFRGLVEQETGVPASLPREPLLVTPFGIALACRNRCTAVATVANKQSSDRRAICL